MSLLSSLMLLAALLAASATADRLTEWDDLVDEEGEERIFTSVASTFGLNLTTALPTLGKVSRVITNIVIITISSAGAVLAATLLGLLTFLTFARNSAPAASAG